MIGIYYLFHGNIYMDLRLPSLDVRIKSLKLLYNFFAAFISRHQYLSALYAKIIAMTILILLTSIEVNARKSRFDNRFKSIES